MIDVLGIVFDFVQTFACNPPNVPAYTNEQIIRGQLNATVPPEMTEIASIVHLGTVRHGTTAESLPDNKSLADIQETAEHIVQIDLYSMEPVTPQERTIERAQVLEMIARSHRGADFFKGTGLQLLYADDVSNSPVWDDTKNYTAHYTMRLHLEQTITRRMQTDYFTGLNVRSAPAHTPEERPAPPGWLQTEPIDKDHI